PGIKFVTAAPEVPIGVYTQNMFDKMSQIDVFGPDFKDRANANIVSREPNVRQVVSKVQLGEADAGVVYGTDVTPSVAPQLKQITVPAQFNIVAEYPIANVKGAGNSAGGQAFIDFVLSPQGQTILKKYGFQPANPTS
ncbi:MAG TPA: molybdate ABC transporter substrate-binding protein, partial [Dehalococcoidia bacterium]